MTANDFEKYVLDTFNIAPDHPFEDVPPPAVFRHKDNRKWFALIMTIPKRRLGINSDELIDVVNLKCPTEMVDSMWQENGIFPAYHMNKAHWITACLDGSASDELILWLLEISFELTKSKKRVK